MFENDRAAGAAYSVNGAEVILQDRQPTARDLLIAAGRKPPSEHQLISTGGGRLRFCPHEDRLPDGEHRFLAFEGDSLFRFTVDEIGQVWGAESAEVRDLLEIFNIEDDHELVLEREGQPDLVLTADGEVQFGPEGVEDLVTRRRRPDKVLVSVLTTNGVFPAEGVVRVDPDSLVSSVLARAARRLQLSDTENWVVTFENRNINPAISFAANGLAGTVTLAWNAPEGGGGHVGSCL